MQILALSLIVIFSLAVMPAALLLAAPGDAAPARAGTPLLVIVPPGAPAAAMVARAGGRLVGPVRAPFGVLAAGEGPGFAARLRAAGAWQVMPAGRLAALCGASA